MFTECDDLATVSIAQLNAVKNWQQQYKLIIQWGRLIKPKPWVRTDEFLIRGCELPVWLSVNVNDEKIYVAYDADSQVIKGLIALLVAQIQEQELSKIKGKNLSDCLQASGLEKHLTPSRNNGLKNIIARLEQTLSAL